MKVEQILQEQNQKNLQRVMKIKKIIAPMDLSLKK